jgi:hypothetical protein
MYIILPLYPGTDRLQDPSSVTIYGCSVLYVKHVIVAYNLRTSPYTSSHLYIANNTKYNAYPSLHALGLRVIPDELKFCFLDLSEILFSSIFHLQLVESIDVVTV